MAPQVHSRQMVKPFRAYCYNTPKIPDMQTVFHKISEWINIIWRNITSMLIFRYGYWKKYVSIKLCEIILVAYAT